MDISKVLTGNNTFSSQDGLNPFQGQNCTKTGQEVQLFIQMYKGLIDIPVAQY